MLVLFCFVDILVLICFWGFGHLCEFWVCLVWVSFRFGVLGLRFWYLVLCYFDVLDSLDFAICLCVWLILGFWCLEFWCFGGLCFEYWFVWVGYYGGLVYLCTFVDTWCLLEFEFCVLCYGGWFWFVLAFGWILLLGFDFLFVEFACCWVFWMLG